MNISHHPAPGLGELLPGFFVVPQNPVTDAVRYIPNLGDIMPGAFVVPQNPVVDRATGNVVPIGTSKGMGGGCGCGCGGHGGCGVAKLNHQPIGMGDLSSDWARFQSDITGGSVMTALQDTVFGVPVWAYGAMLALFMFTGGKESHYRRGRRALAAY